MATTMQKDSPIKMSTEDMVAKTANIRKMYETSERRFVDKMEKLTFSEVRYHTRNTYIGLFVSDMDNNCKTADGKYLLYGHTGSEILLNEYTPWSICIIDRQFADTSRLDQLHSEYIQRYVYMVDSELHSEVYKNINEADRPLIASHDSYPGIRIFNSYDAMIRRIEFKYAKKNIFVMSDIALLQMRYFISFIHIIKNPKLSFGANAIDIPLQHMQDFIGLRMVKQIDHTFKETIDNSVDQDKLLKDIEKEALYAQMFYGQVKVDSPAIRKAKASFVDKQYVYEIWSRMPQQFSLYRFKSTSKRHIAAMFSENEAFLKIPHNCLRIKAANNVAFIYDCRFDLVVAVKALSEVEQYFIKVYELPYAIAIKQNDIVEWQKAYSELNISDAAFTATLQLQNR